MFNSCWFLYQEQNKEADIDSEYELQQKDKEIEKLKQEITIHFPPITEKPNDNEPNIFKESKDGKITSVEWLIDKEKVDQNKRVKGNNNELKIYKNYCIIKWSSFYFSIFNRKTKCW